MIVSVNELIKNPDFSGQDSSILQEKLNAIELLIRKYTNNNFQNRNIRFLAPSDGNVLYGSCLFLKAGDTVQITESLVNDGLYVVQSVGDTTEIDTTIFPVEHNLVTKVEYPIDVKMGVINLMRWEITTRNKVGIKSETISRHSVTYYDQDSNNQVMGYPVSLLGFLEPYKKARF